MLPTTTIRVAPCVGDIMTPHVHTLQLDDTLRAAASLFDRERFHHVVILEHGRVKGVVSDRDILKVVSPFAGNPMLERPQDLSTLKKRVHQIMTRKLVTIGSEQTVAAAADLMLTQRVSCLPVVDEHCRLLGIVTIRDLLGQLAALNPHS